MNWPHIALESNTRKRRTPQIEREAVRKRRHPTRQTVPFTASSLPTPCEKVGCRWAGERADRLQHPATTRPNQALEPTPYSVRCAHAIGRG
jgi:hypothetical protein